MRRCRCQTAVEPQVILLRCKVYLMPTRQIKACGTARNQCHLIGQLYDAFSSPYRVN
jgi:hypothetical protein